MRGTSLKSTVERRHSLRSTAPFSRRETQQETMAPEQVTTEARQESVASDRLTIEACQGDRGCLVRLAGELDAAAAPNVRHVVEPWARSCRRLTLDLRKVTFLDSAGLRVVLDLYRLLREREVSLHLLEGSEGNVPRVLRHAGLESLIDSAEDRAH